MPYCAVIMHHGVFFPVIRSGLQGLVASTQDKPLKDYYEKLLSLHEKHDFSIAAPRILSKVLIDVENYRKALGVDEKQVTGHNSALYKTIDYGLFTGKKDSDRWGARTYIRLLKEKRQLLYCPYCNCESITPTDAWPALDHYFPHAKFPYFALSLFNLIPSCDTCNKPPHKGCDYYPLDTNTHPFVDDVHGELKFRTELKRIEDWTNGKETVEFEDVGKRAGAARQFLGSLGVLDEYNVRHRREVADIASHLHGYSEQYKRDEARRYPGLLDYLDPRMVGGEQVGADTINAFPMGKLRLDLFEQHVGG